MTDTTAQAGTGAEQSGGGAAAMMNGAGSASAGTDGQQGEGTQPFYHDYEDGDVKNWLAAKNYADPKALATAAWNAEKKIGEQNNRIQQITKAKPEQVLVLPEVGSDKYHEQLTAVYQKLGAPEKPDGYDLKGIEGLDAAKDPLLQAMLPVLHGAGVTQTQAKAIVTEFHKNMQAMATSQQTTLAEDRVNGENKLRGEWAGQFTERTQQAAQAWAALSKPLDFTTDDLTAIETALGTYKTMRMLAHLAGKMGEGNLPGLKEGGGFHGLTPAEAKAQLDAKTKDMDFMKKVKNQEPQAAAEYKALIRQSRNMAAR